MIKYITKRILMILPIVLAIIFVLFVLLYMLPASRIRQIPIYGSHDTLDSLFTFFHASDNLITKYFRYCYNVFFHFDFGQTGSMSPLLIYELPARIRTTLILLTSGIGATLIFGIPIGVYSAVHKGSKRDRAISIVTLLFSSLPNYSLAMLIVLVFVLYLKILPMLPGYMSPESFYMPMLTIALGGISSIARITRASMLEILEMPYITALRTKGLKEANVVYHALKNALVPVVSVLGSFISQMLFGTFVIEHFFNVPGLGSYLLRSMGMRAHFEILGCTVVVTIILAITNILADIFYAFLSPQIRLRFVLKANSRLKRGIS